MSREFPISVLLCVRTLSAPLLPGALQSLRSQSLSEKEWELIIVVNEGAANEPGKPPVVVGGRFVVMHEPRPGLLWARLRGLSECRGRYVVLMDDDARFEPDFLASVKRFFEAVPRASVVGGSVEADPSGCQPPLALRRAFALRAVEETQPVEAVELTDAPVGIGMALRREAIAEWAMAVHGCAWRQSLGRVGSLGGAGEDLDMVATALGSGREVWISRDLCVRHHIPPERLRPCYVRTLVRVNNLGRRTVLYHHQRLSVSPPRRFPRWRLFIFKMRSLWFATRRDWARLIAVEQEIALLQGPPASAHIPSSFGGCR